MVLVLIRLKIYSYKIKNFKYIAVVSIFKKAQNSKFGAFTIILFLPNHIYNILFHP